MKKRENLQDFILNSGKGVKRGTDVCTRYVTAIDQTNGGNMYVSLVETVVPSDVEKKSVKDNARVMIRIVGLDNSPLSPKEFSEYYSGLCLEPEVYSQVQSIEDKTQDTMENNGFDYDVHNLCMLSGMIKGGVLEIDGACSKDDKFLHCLTSGLLSSAKTLGASKVSLPKFKDNNQKVPGIIYSRMPSVSVQTLAKELNFLGKAPKTVKEHLLAAKDKVKSSYDQPAGKSAINPAKCEFLKDTCSLDGLRESIKTYENTNENN